MKHTVSVTSGKFRNWKALSTREEKRHWLKVNNLLHLSHKEQVKKLKEAGLIAKTTYEADVKW